jgi:hypothetical protein
MISPPQDSIAGLITKIRMLTDSELAELELATDEVLGRVEPE